MINLQGQKEIVKFIEKKFIQKKLWNLFNLQEMQKWLWINLRDYMGSVYISLSYW